jgi:hypothetical protein
MVQISITMYVMFKSTHGFSSSLYINVVVGSGTLSFIPLPMGLLSWQPIRHLKR